MERLGAARVLQLTLRGQRNFMTDHPLVVSFELTGSCNAHCKHCDKGGILKDEATLPPARIGELFRELRPVAVQLSGGEPLLREDVEEVARAIKPRGRRAGAPYLILVSNGSLLDVDRYERLRAAGVDQFSLSLDFPDERHDEFRRLPGLFRRLERVVPQLTAHGHGDVVMNCAVSRLNFDEVTRLAQVANGWGAAMSYSTYSAMRTGNTDYLVTAPEDLRRLRARMDEVVAMKLAGADIRNAVPDLEATYRFFAEGGIAGCRAGFRFLLVQPDGWMRPCAHQAFRARTHRELREGFTRTNTCGGCYVAIRSYCDKSWARLVQEQVLARVPWRDPAPRQC